MSPEVESGDGGGILAADHQQDVYKRQGNDVDIWVVNAADPASARMVAQMEGGGWDASDWSPDGKRLLATNGVSAAESLSLIHI